MKRKKLVGLMGAIALTLGVSSNLQYAMNDYDVASNSLHVEVLAQSSCSSGGGGTTGGAEVLYTRVTGECKYSGSGAGCWQMVSLAPGISVKADFWGNWTYVAEKAEVRCLGNGNEKCEIQNCPPFPGKTT